MDPRLINRKFIFRPEMDRDYLYSLYEDDYTYIAQVLTAANQDLESVVPEMEQAWHARDLGQLARALHRIKPLFGYAGLLTHQEKLASFEQQFRNGHPDDNLDEDFRRMMQVVLTGKIILEDESNRLTLYLQCA